MTSRVPVTVGAVRRLVTGGPGFIGANFVHRTVRERPGVSVTVLEALTYAGCRESLRPVEDHIRLVGGDVTDEPLVDPLVAESDPRGPCEPSGDQFRVRQRNVDRGAGKAADCDAHQSCSSPRKSLSRRPVRRRPDLSRRSGLGDVESTSLPTRPTAIERSRRSDQRRPPWHATPRIRALRYSVQQRSATVSLRRGPMGRDRRPTSRSPAAGTAMWRMRRRPHGQSPRQDRVGRRNCQNRSGLFRHRG